MKKSTNLQLLKYCNSVIDNVSRGSQVDSVYLDFAKAFDTVVHWKLLFKLQFYGVTGNLIKWIESFLVGRVQSVRVGNSLSDWSNVVSGVPQGSVWDLYFLLFLFRIYHIAAIIYLIFCFYLRTMQNA